MSKNSSDQETVKKSSIDRPRRKPQKKLKIEEEVSLDNEEEEYHLKEYEAIRSEYTEFSLSNTIINILYKVVQTSACLNAAYKKAAMKQLISAAKDLALNEMEASLWTIYLQKIDWKSLSSTCYLDLLFAAYASKSYLNENLKPFNVYLEKMNANFLKSYESWHSTHKHLLKIDSKEINNRFKEYSKPYLGLGEVQIIDYNHCVDDILRIAMDSSVKEEKEEKLENIEDGEGGEESETNENSPGKVTIGKIVKEEISASPIFGLDALSPLPPEEISKDKNQISFDSFVNPIPKLGEIPDFPVFGDGTPGFGRTPSINTPGLPTLTPNFSSVLSPGYSPLIFKNSAFNGFPNFNE
ncbi:unnamed protein product [Blepharisma stoltei]|uniref:Uncharacterized protein n=1 Tax=Blepharisma stoltei TaxID=1481888 RepID=A0AAU9J7U9_9CILI|nr:unnamed protein product [Blepharisma stoltei]